MEKVGCRNTWTPCSFSTSKMFCHCLKKADYNVIRHVLTLTNWTKIIHSNKDDVQVLYNSIIDYLKSIIDIYIPYQAITYKPKKIHSSLVS